MFGLKKKFVVNEHTTHSMIYDYIHSHPNCKFTVKMSIPRQMCGFVFKDSEHFKVCKCHFLPDEKDTYDIFKQMKQNDNDTRSDYKGMKYIYKVHFGTDKEYWDDTMYWDDFCNHVIHGFVKFI